MLQGMSWGNQWEYWQYFDGAVDDHRVMFDGPTRTIWILEGISEILVKEHLYSDWKEWMALYDNSKYLQAFQTEGGRPISATERLGDSYLLINDWVIRQRNADTPVNVDGNLYAYDLDDNPKDPYDVDPFGGRSINSTVSNIVNTISTGGGGDIDYDLVAGAVWNALRADYNTANTMGERMNDPVPTDAPTLTEIVNGVWDEPTADHTTVGSTGEAVAAGGSGGSCPNADTIADAVWDKSTTENTTAGTRGAEASLTYEESRRARAMQTNKVSIASTGEGDSQVDTITVYDDDGVTVLYELRVTGVDCDNRSVQYEKPM